MPRSETPLFPAGSANISTVNGLVCSGGIAMFDSSLMIGFGVFLIAAAF
jgi:hypothetical protein